MKTKIKLIQDDPRTINIILDLVKTLKGEVLEYSDSHIVIDGENNIREKIITNKIVSFKIENN